MSDWKQNHRPVTTVLDQPAIRIFPKACGSEADALSTWMVSVLVDKGSCEVVSVIWDKARILWMCLMTCSEFFSKFLPALFEK